MKEKDIRFAVASKDGQIVNQHFGHAERFLIYGVSGKTIKFLEERKVNHYCLGEDTYEHPFEENRFMDIVNTIKDCRYVLVSRIGTVPEKKLKANGILSIMMYDKIDECISKVLQKEGTGKKEQ